MCKATRTVEERPHVQRLLLEIIEGCKRIVAGAKHSVKRGEDHELAKRNA